MRVLSKNSDEVKKQQKKLEEELEIRKARMEDELKKQRKKIDDQLEKQKEMVEARIIKKVPSIMVLIISSIIICTFIFAGISTVISMKLSKQVNRKTALEEVEAMAAEYSNEINEILTKYETLATGIEYYVGATYNDLNSNNGLYNTLFMIDADEYLSHVYEENAEFTRLSFFINPEISGSVYGLKIVNGEHEQILADAEYSQYIANEGEWAYYNAVAAAGKGLWFSPKIDETIGKEVITYYHPIYSSKASSAGTLNAIVGIQFDFSDIKQDILNISVLNGGSAILIDDSNKIAVAKDMELGSELQDNNVVFSQDDYVYDNEERRGLFNTIYYNGEKCIAAFNYLNNDYTCMIIVPQSDIDRGINEARSKIIILEIVAFIILVGLAVVVGINISGPLRAITNDMSLVATGNFTGEKYKKYVGLSNESGMLARAVEDMQHFMKNTVANVSENGKTISDSSINLKKAVDGLMDQISNISGTTEQLAASMEETAATAEDLSSAADNMTAYINDMNRQNEDGNKRVVEISERALNLKNESMKAAKEAKEQSEVATKDLNEAIESSREVEKITALTDTILNIADETSLLALNASIEAARAGEAGRGFAVVADEISKLAVNSQESAKLIQTITTNVREAVDKLCESSSSMLEFMEDRLNSSYEKLLSTGEMYNDDATSIKETFKMISDAANGISKEVMTVIQAFGVLRDATSEGAEDTTEVAQAAEDITLNTKNVQTETEKLEMIAKSLDEYMKRFIV